MREAEVRLEKRLAELTNMVQEEANKLEKCIKDTVTALNSKQSS